MVGMPSTVKRQVMSASAGSTSHSTRSWSRSSGSVPGEADRARQDAAPARAGRWARPPGCTRAPGPGRAASGLGDGDAAGSWARTGADPAIRTATSARLAGSRANRRRDHRDQDTSDLQGLGPRGGERDAAVGSGGHGRRRNVLSRLGPSPGPWTLLAEHRRHYPALHESQIRSRGGAADGIDRQTHPFDRAVTAPVGRRHGGRSAAGGLGPVTFGPGGVRSSSPTSPSLPPRPSGRGRGAGGRGCAGRARWVTRRGCRHRRGVRDSGRARGHHVGGARAGRDPRPGPGGRVPLGARPDRFEPYPGVLRGAQGTLAARAGNAFDRALLLRALLDAMAIPARFAFGELDQASARALVARTLGPIARPTARGR